MTVPAMGGHEFTKLVFSSLCRPEKHSSPNQFLNPKWGRQSCRRGTFLSRRPCNRFPKPSSWPTALTLNSAWAQHRKSEPQRNRAATEGSSFSQRYIPLLLFRHGSPVLFASMRFARLSSVRLSCFANGEVGCADRPAEGGKRIRRVNRRRR